PVHRDRQRLVRLAADRAERHRAGAEAAHDALDRLDLLERYRLAVLGEAQQPAGRVQLAALVVDPLRVLLVQRVVVAPPRGRDAGDGRGVHQVALAAAPPLVLAAEVELGVDGTVGGIGVGVAPPRLLRQRTQRGAADARGAVREELV